MKKKYVIRHYWRCWADFFVEAESEEEAFEIACEKYNEGDYTDIPENFENEGAENVTDHFQIN